MGEGEGKIYLWVPKKTGGVSFFKGGPMKKKLEGGQKKWGEAGKIFLRVAKLVSTLFVLSVRFINLTSMI